MSNYDEYVLAGVIASCLEGDDYDSSGASYFCSIEDGCRVMVRVVTSDDRGLSFLVTVENADD